MLAKMSVEQSLMKANSYAKKGEVAEAQKLYQAVLKAFSKNKRAQQGLATLKKLKQNNTIQSPPQEVVQQLVNLYNQGQIVAVVEQAEILTEQYPGATVVWNILGVSRTQIGKLDEAIEAYKKSISLKPDFALAHYNLASTLQELVRLEEAEASYTKAIALKPNHAEAHYNLGNMLKELGRLDEAEASYKQAIVFKPDYAEAHSNLGNMLQELGRLDEAIQVYNKAISILPDSSVAWNNIFFPLQAIKTELSSREELISYYPESKNSKYVQIAKSILNYKLHLGGENAASLLNDTLNFLTNAENITIQNPESHKISIDLEPILPNKVVALVHFGRSGTGVLHSLIDGHPEVSTLPSIYFSEYFDQSTWEKMISGGWSEMANRFVAIYDVLFNASSTVPIQSKYLIYNIGEKDGMANVGDQRDEVLSVDKTLFCEELNRLMDCYEELNAFSFFKLVHFVYDKAINDLNQKNLVFYHIHNPGIYSQLNFVRSAPNTNWVMMVREPLQSCESWLQEDFQENNYNKMKNKIFEMLFAIDNIIYRKQTSIGVRLEDLKEYPRKTIPALCKWMGIKETESLYEMTAQGKKWWGDPSSPDYSTDGMDPFGKTSINRKVGSIFSENDQFILRTLFYPFSLRFGYVEENSEQFKADLKAIRPMLDQMLGFEERIVERTHADPDQFMKSGSYLYLRSGLLERWEVLNEFKTYPNMIKPLEI